MIFWAQAANTAIALFIITDVFGNLPFYLALTDGATPQEKGKTAFTAVVTGLILLAFFVFAGNLVFDLFSLTLNDLRIAGGVLLFVIALDILFRNKISIEHRDDIGVVPLGCPLLVGPGAITTTLMLANLYNFYAVIIGVLICFFFIWLVLHYADFAFRIIGKNGAMIITKISAIIIATVAVRFIREGIMAILHL